MVEHLAILSAVHRWRETSCADLSPALTSGIVVVTHLRPSFFGYYCEGKEVKGGCDCVLTDQPELTSDQHSPWPLDISHENEKKTMQNMVENCCK